MILKLNSKGNLVKDLQIKLNRLGFIVSKVGLGSPGNETAFFGKLTKNAVKKFQRANKLKPDGIVGPKTWNTLLKNEQNNVIPIYANVPNEDFSDPEDEMKVHNLKESAPTSSHIIELINLIRTAKITRNINRLVFHCTATNQNATVTAIQRYWKDVLKWKNPGYHIIIKPDGTWTQLSDFNNITNGVAGINSTSLHISYIGGINDKGDAIDNRTNEQKEVLKTVYWSFRDKLPNLTFHGHYEFSSKKCPSYNVQEWIDDLIKENKNRSLLSSFVKHLINPL